MSEADPLFTTPAPRLSTEAAEVLARARFGVVGRARALTSERDLNFRIRAEDGRTYVLKVANAAEEAAVLDFQNRALDHIAAADPDLPTPRVVPTTDGAAMFESQGSLVRLLTWLALIPSGVVALGIWRLTARRGNGDVAPAAEAEG